MAGLPCEERLAGLRRALRRLAPEQGRIARGNARRAVRSAVRGLLAEVDKLYPGVRKVPKRTGRLINPHVRWKREGFIPFPSHISEHDRALRMRDLAAARVEVRVANGTGWPWVPEWALAAGVNEVRKLKRMKRDLTYRKAEWSVAALKTLEKKDHAD